MSQQQLFDLREALNRKAWRTVACKNCGRKGKTQELERICDGCMTNWKSCLTCQHAAAMSDPECEMCCGTGRYEGLLCTACPDGDCFGCIARKLIGRISLERCNR